MASSCLLVTNVQDLSLEEVVARYKFLADIERGFKVLKSELEIGPVYHRVRLNGAPPVSGVSSTHECQSEVLHALRVKNHPRLSN